VIRFDLSREDGVYDTPMIGIRTAPLGLLRRQVWLQAFPLLVCQISSCHATSVPALTICKHALGIEQVGVPNI
jgi:hypothetical protein